MRKPGVKLRKSLEKALKRFEAGLGDAMPYLDGRGITEATAKRFRLGVVSFLEEGSFEEWRGRLAIPYLDRLGVYGYKFRCLEHEDCKQYSCKKYLNPSGQGTSIYGVLELDDDEADTLHVTEGEMDRISLSQFTDQPVIGFPGSEAWQDHWVCHFSGFERVLCWKHGDRAGDKWASRLRSVCRVVEIVELPPGEDVNSLILSWGPEKVLALANGEEDE